MIEKCTNNIIDFVQLELFFSDIKSKEESKSPVRIENLRSSRGLPVVLAQTGLVGGQKYAFFVIQDIGLVQSARFNCCPRPPKTRRSAHKNE